MQTKKMKNYAAYGNSHSIPPCIELYVVRRRCDGKWETATQNASALEKAYRKGYYAALQIQAESEE